jgi:hypothetical protein
MRQIARAIAVLGVALTAASPAAALSLTSNQAGTIFCFGRLSGDMAPVIAILTDDLAGLVAAKTKKSGADSVPWQEPADYANTCDAVGAQGTFDAPEIVLAFGFRDASKAGFAQNLVMRFVDQRLRIDDIKFGDGTTLRARLAGD